VVPSVARNIICFLGIRQIDKGCMSPPFPHQAKWISGCIAGRFHLSWER